MTGLRGRSHRVGARQVAVNRAAADSARRGHPWIWRGAVTNVAPTLAAGEVVQLVDPSGEAIGAGIYDPESPIAVRMWASGSTSLNDELLAARIASAFRVREWLF